MGQTTNFNLYVTDDDQEKFLAWRENIAGTVDSNMVKIDLALAEHDAEIESLLQKVDTLATKTKSVDCILSAESWTGDSRPYTQDINVDGATSESNGIIFVSHSATAEQREASRLAMLGIVNQSDSLLTVVADGEDKPSVDIPVTVLIFG